MQLEFNKNPEMNNDQVETNDSSEEMYMEYLEVVPSLPTYHIERMEVTKVLKFLFNPQTMECEKVVIEYTHGFCHIVEYDGMDFSTLPINPCVMPGNNIVDVFIGCDFDIYLAERQLAKWGINKVYLIQNPAKTASVHAMLEGILKCLEEASPGKTEVVCEDGHLETLYNLFLFYKTDKLIEDVKAKH